MSEDLEQGKAPDIVLFKSDIEAAAARVAERALNDTWTGVGGFFGDVLGGLIGDRTRLWRTRNLIVTLAKTRDFLSKYGVSVEKAKSLPMGEALAIFEGASKTDDVDLQEMWAALLANRMRPDKGSFIDPSFPRLLTELSGLDAQIINFLSSFERLNAQHQRDLRGTWAGFDGKTKDVEAMEKKREAQQAILTEFANKVQNMIDAINDHYSEEHVSYSLSNLSRLGLIDIPEKKTYGRPTLIQINFDVRNDKIALSTAGLEAELKDLRLRQGLGYSNDKTLPKIAQNAHAEIPVPSFALTDFAKRFLEACAPKN